MTEQDPVQQAVAGRLAKLRTLPVDTSRLDRKLRQELPAAPSRRLRWWAAWAPLTAVAAALLLIAVIVVILQARPVEASTSDMAQMYYDIVSQKTPIMTVESIEQADKAIAAMAQDAPQLPNVPAAHHMACCMKNLGNKQVACVLLKNEGVPVTMSVAKAADVTPPKNTTTQTVDGVTYHIQTIGKLHMVMLNHHGDWVCLISEAPASTLIALAGRLPR